jgi:tetratricopeptide (TPR) repeat protein
MGDRRFEGPHGGPGNYRPEMMHSPGPHWEGYHHAHVGNHNVHLAHPGYHPSYYYHPWYHGPWGGHPWGWGWGYAPGVNFGLAGSGWAVSVGNAWGYPAYYGPYGPYGYWGRPLGWGFGGWGLGTTVYTSGYYVYENPYYSPVIYNTVVYDYSRPIPVVTQVAATNGAALSSGGPATGSAPQVNNPAFDAAREAFRRGDYAQALANIDAAIRATPSDAVMHEFRSLVLFAMRDYRQSAAVAHSVLAVGPGWDYTTMSSLYPDPFTYSAQLRQLEDYTRQHPRAAEAHFLLAYHSMINSRKDAAIQELQQVVSLMPNDRLAGELLTMVKGPPKTVPATNVAASPFPPPKTTYDGTTVLLSDPKPATAAPRPATTVAGAPSPEPIDQALLPGTWNASRDDGSQFHLTLTEEGTFVWKFSSPNQKEEELRGKYSVDGPVLILERKEGGALAGTAVLNGTDQMKFKMVGAPPQDDGLDFEKS